MTDARGVTDAGHTDLDFLPREQSRGEAVRSGEPTAERRQGWVRVGKWCSVRLDGSENLEVLEAGDIRVKRNAS